MNQLQQNTVSPPKSPYQLFIEENDQLLNSISQHDIQSDITTTSDLNLQDEGNSESEYYESLKESIDSINAKLGISSKKKEKRKTNSNISDIGKSRDDSIAQIDSQSDILPPKKDFCPSPLNKHDKSEGALSISSEKDKNLINSENDNLADRNSNVKDNGEDKNSQYSIKSNTKTKLTPQLKAKSKGDNLISKSPSNSSVVKNTPTKEQIQDENKVITSPTNNSTSSALRIRNDDNSIKSFKSTDSNNKKNNSIINNSPNSSIKKENSFASNHSQSANINKENSFVSNHSQATNNKKENSFVSNHSQTANINKENSFVSNHSQATNIKKENSFASNHSQATNIKKENSFASNHSQTANIKKENSFASNHSQTPNIKRGNSIISNHSQTPTITKRNSVISSGNQSPDIKKQNSVVSNRSQVSVVQKENTINSNQSQTPNSNKGYSSTMNKSMITTSYIDYIDTKQKRILEKWKNEDLEAQRNLEEEIIDRLLTPKHTWKTFKFTSPRGSISSRSSISNDSKTEISSNFNDEDELEKSIDDNDDQNQKPTQVFEMPPNPSSNFKQMLEIPAIERLITPKKNFSLQQQQKQIKKKQNSTRPKKIRPMNEIDFVSRQAHYENEKRLKKTMENTDNQPKKTKRKNGDDVFSKLYEKSIVEDFDSSDAENDDSGLSNENEKRSKIKWSNKSHLIESKKIPDPEPPINTSEYRDDRFSPMSQKIAQNESRSFQERTSVDFNEVLRQDREEKEQKKKRDLYYEHLENLD